MNPEYLMPKLLSEVGPYFAKHLGLDWCENREEVLTAINEFRELLHIHPNVPDLFTHLYFCIKPSRFCLDCQNYCSCNTHFLGFTLPESIVNIEQSWLDTQPTTIHSKWYEGHNGIKHNMSALEPGTIIYTGKVSPVQRMQPSPSHLMFSSKGNEGKKVYVEYYNIDHEIVKDEITIRANSVVGSSNMSFGVCSIVLSELDNPLLLTDEEGYELAHYSGRFTVPQFKLYKVAIQCDSKILIQGKQKFFDLCFDEEIVEIGARNILKEIAKYFRYSDSGTDSEESNAALRAEQRFIQLIRGATDNQRGEEHQDGDRHHGRTMKLGGHKLKGYKRRKR
jgi:hypothetical protein